MSFSMRSLECTDVSPARMWGFGLIALALSLILAGFLGLDRWFYEHVSQRLDTKDQPLDRDIYTLTKPLWLTLRGACAHLLGVLTVYVAFLTLWPKRWPQLCAAAIAVVMTALLANVAQGAIGRLRPNQADGDLAFAPPLSRLLVKQEVSFPSGEAATAAAAATTLALLFPRWRALFWSLAALTAAARLVNGAHYLSDVIAGFLLGALLARVLYHEILARSDARISGRVPARLRSRLHLPEKGER